MPASDTAPAPLLLGFLAVLARVMGVVSFLPIPGSRSGPDVVRIVFSLGLTVALYPLWPAVPSVAAPIGWTAAMLLSEAAFGITAGLFVSFLLESLLVAAQILGLQAGFSYSSTIDPTSQADSTVLQVAFQLVAALLFFVCGLHHQIIRAFAASLRTLPPGAFAVSADLLDLALKSGSAMLLLGVRLALPVVALLLLVDIAMALMGRINAQLQLLSLAFPAKMLAGLALLAALAPLVPVLFEGGAARTFQALERLAAAR
jgi:flagellar biosynthetic protein FliR